MRDLDWPVGKSERMITNCFRRRSPLWAASFPGKVLGSVRKLSMSLCVSHGFCFKFWLEILLCLPSVKAVDLEV